MKVNEALADALAIEANGPIFGLMGDANMKWKGRDARDAMWKSPDYVALARGFGGDGVRIGKECELAAAIAQAMKGKGPFVIDAHISPTMVSDAYSRIFLGQENQLPLLRPVKARLKKPHAV